MAHPIDVRGDEALSGPSTRPPDEAVRVPPATPLVRTPAAGVRERGDTPFPQVAAARPRAIRLHESIGSVLRRPATVLRLRTPGTDREAGLL